MASLCVALLVFSDWRVLNQDSVKSVVSVTFGSFLFCSSHLVTFVIYSLNCFNVLRRELIHIHDLTDCGLEERYFSCTMKPNHHLCSNLRTVLKLMLLSASACETCEFIVIFVNRVFVAFVHSRWLLLVCLCVIVSSTLFHSLSVRRIQLAHLLAPAVPWLVHRTCHVMSCHVVLW